MKMLNIILENIDKKFMFFTPNTQAVFRILSYVNNYCMLFLKKGQTMNKKTLTNISDRFFAKTFNSY